MATPSSPTLITPANDAVVVGNVLVFVFSVPSDDDSDSLVFRLELDTVDPPSSSNTNYKINESRYSSNQKTHGKWEVKNGSGNYIVMPSGGVKSDYYGRDAKVTIRLRDTVNYPALNTDWYWRISASDAMMYPPVYNKVIYGRTEYLNL